MSRRDTIIIAVLLNAGLLIVLFATSLRTDNTVPEATSALAMSPAAVQIEEAQSSQPLVIAPNSQTAISQSSDAVDQMMQQYTTPAIADGKPNFAADLQAIGSQEVSTLSPQASSPIPESVTDPAPSLATTFKEIKVKKGDVLERIARQNHVSVDELMKTNNLSSTRLKIGQVLKVPSTKSSTKSENSFSISKPVDEASSKYYIIKVGDNPWTIAVKNHMKVEELLKLNNLNEEKARRLKPGDKIRIK